MNPSSNGTEMKYKSKKEQILLRLFALNINLVKKFLKRNYTFMNFNL